MLQANSEHTDPQHDSGRLQKPAQIGQCLSVRHVQVPCIPAAVVSTSRPADRQGSVSTVLVVNRGAAVRTAESAFFKMNGREGQKGEGCAALLLLPAVCQPIQLSGVTSSLRV